MSYERAEAGVELRLPLPAAFAVLSLKAIFLNSTVSTTKRRAAALSKLKIQHSNRTAIVDLLCA
jgi:hypothetical protein